MQMRIYGQVALKAWDIAAKRRLSPPDAWQTALEECKAAAKSCPKSAFLGLCEEGLLRSIDAGHYTRSRRSRAFALAAVERLRGNPSLAAKKADLEADVYGDRAPNGEVDVVLALWQRGMIE